MTTWEEFKKGKLHDVDYGMVGNKILELGDPNELWKWTETQNLSEFEKGIVVGLVTAWIEIFVKGRG